MIVDAMTAHCYRPQILLYDKHYITDVTLKRPWSAFAKITIVPTCTGKEYIEDHFICIVFISKYTQVHSLSIWGLQIIPLPITKLLKITSHIIFPQ